MQPPEGFVLDSAPQQSNSGLPEGFVMDAQPTSGPASPQPVYMPLGGALSAIDEVVKRLPQGAQSNVASAQRGLAQGGTFGFGDEIVGGATALLTDQSYADVVARERQANQVAQDANPVFYTGGEIAGAIGTGGAAGGARLGAVKSSVAGGAAYGTGTAEGGVKERAKGGAVGAGLGLLGQQVGQRVLSPVANYAGKSLSNKIRTAIQKVSEGRNNSMTKPQRRAYAKYRKLISESGITPDEFMKKLDNADAVGLDEDFLFELAGSQGRQAAEGLATRGTDAAQEGVKRVRARQTMQQFRVSEELNKAFGSDGGDILTQSKAIQSAKKAAAPLYDKFRSLKGLPAQDVMEVLGGDFEAVFNQAAKSAERRSGVKFDGSRGEISPDILNRMKVALSERTQTATRTGDATGRGDNSALERRFVDFLDERYPEVYKAARQAFAGPAAQQEAMDLGEGLIRSTVTRRNPEQLAEEVAKMSDDQVASFRIGVARAIRSEMAKGNTGRIGAEDFGDPGNLIKRFFNNTEKQEAVRAAFGNDEQFNRFAKKMIKLNEQAENFNQVNVKRSGSQTASRLGASDTAAELFEGVRDAAVSDAGKIRGIAKVIQRFTADKETEEQLAKLLFSKPSDQRQAIVSNLSKLSQEQRDAEIVKLLSDQIPLLTATGTLATVE